jgi:hypothetical protein
VLISHFVITFWQNGQKIIIYVKTLIKDFQIAIDFWSAWRLLQYDRGKKIILKWLKVFVWRQHLQRFFIVYICITGHSCFITNFALNVQDCEVDPRNKTIFNKTSIYSNIWVIVFVISLIIPMTKENKSIFCFFIAKMPDEKIRT